MSDEHVERFARAMSGDRGGGRVANLARLKRALAIETDLEIRPKFTVERILSALEEVDHRIAEQLEENVLFTDADDAGRRDYAVALHALLTQ